MAARRPGAGSAPRPPAEPRLRPALEPVSLRPEHVEDGARWSGIALEGAGLAGVEARALRIDEARVRDADLSGARLAGFDLRDAELVRCNLANALARDSSMTRVVVAESRLTGLQWPEGTVQDVVFRGCRIDLASFRFATLRRVAFEDCVMPEADFQDARCDSVSFHDCDLSGTSFQNARFERSELRRCTLDDLRGIGGLRGAAMEWTDIVALAGSFAAALGLRVIDDDA